MTSNPDLTTPVSVVLATSGEGGILWEEPRSFVLEAVRSLRATSRHEALEFVVVHSDRTHPATLTALVELPDIDLVLVPFDGPANASAMLNVGALHAAGQVLVFADERTQASSDETIGHVVAPLSKPDVGLVGAKLLSADGTIRHAGMTVSDGQVELPWLGRPDSEETSPDLFRDRVVDGLDASFVAIDARLFGDVGGWSQEIPSRYRDLDLGFKIRREGRTLHWTPASTLWRFESEGVRGEPTAWEIAFMTRRWGRDLSPVA